MLSAEQFSEIVNAFKDSKLGSQHQSRRAPRFTHTAKTTIFRPARNAADAAVPIEMRDFSARGFSFTVKQPLERGSNFILRFSRKDRPPIAVLCTVMHCRPHGDQFKIGAEFTCPVDIERTAVPASEKNAEMDRIRDSILG